MRTITDSTRRAALRSASGGRRASPWLFAALGAVALAVLLAI